MADNVTANTTDGGGPTFASDDIGGVQYPRIKLIHGADGTNDGDVSSANPLPVNVAEIGGSAARTGNLDTGAGTDTYPIIGLAYGANGGATLVTDSNQLPVVLNQDVHVVQVDSSGNPYSAAFDGMNTTSSTTKMPPAVLVGQFDDTTPTAITEGRFGNVRMSTRREVYVQLRDAAGNERGLNIDANGAIDITASDGIDVSGSAVDVSTQPARAATTDNIGAKLATDAIMNGTTALTPKFAVIDAATSGDNTLVAAVTGKKIRVLACFLVAAGAVNARFESGAGGTALTGQMNLTTNSGFTLPFNPVGWFETAANTLLNLELSGAVSVDGCLTYVEV